MIDKGELQNEIQNGKSNKELATLFNCSVETVKKYIKKFGLQRDNRFANWDIEKLRGLASTCKTKREILLKMGFRDAGSVYLTLNKIAEENNISLPNNFVLANGTKFNPYLSNDEFFVENSNRNGSAIKKRLLKMGVKEECSICNLGKEWNGSQLNHHIDHINGVHTDNRLENLRLLCPNCHDQQETSHRIKASKRAVRITCPECENKYLRKNQSICKSCKDDKKVKRTFKEDNFCSCGVLIDYRSVKCIECANMNQQRKFDPTVSELEKVLKEHNYNMSAVGRYYNVSDNAVRKRCKKLNINFKKISE